MQTGRAQLVPRESCLCPCLHKQPQGAALNRKSHLPHSKLNIAGLSPSASQRSRACGGISCLGVSWKAVLSLPISKQGAGVCWSEQGDIGNATSISPARRPEELLWVLQSLLGQSAEGRLHGGVGLRPRTHFS